MPGCTAPSGPEGTAGRARRRGRRRAEVRWAGTLSCPAMGVLEGASREHLELKRAHGASAEEVTREEHEALGPARRQAAEEEAEASAAEEAVPADEALDEEVPFNEEVPFDEEAPVEARSEEEPVPLDDEA